MTTTHRPDRVDTAAAWLARGGWRRGLTVAAVTVLLADAVRGLGPEPPGRWVAAALIAAALYAAYFLGYRTPKEPRP